MNLAKNELFKNIYRLILGNGESVCRLCFALLHPNEQQTRFVEDLITLRSPVCKETIELTEILMILGIHVDKSLSNPVCDDCTNEAIKSFIFFRKCQEANKMLSESLLNLERSVQSINSFSLMAKTAFLSVNDLERPAILCNTSISAQSSSYNRLHVAAYSFNRIKIKKGVQKKPKKEEKDRAVCQVCGLTFKHKYKLTEHMKKQHSTDVCPCPHCHKVFKLADCLQDHIENVHLPKTLSCTKCSRKFSTERRLHIHNKDAHMPKTCKFCLILLPSKNAYLKHLETHYEHKCPQCNKLLKSKMSLKNHIKICCNAGPIYKCDLCSKEFFSKSRLIGHMSVAHDFGTCYTCMWCGKKYRCLSSLKSHEIKHTKVKDFRCEICGGSFVSKAAVTIHTRLHTGEKPFQCDMCDMTFISASRRMEHRRRKHLGPHIECPVCKMKFVKRSELNKHKKRHFNPQSKLFTGID